MVTLLYFAGLREAVGISEEQIALPEGIETPNALTRWLAARGGGYATAFASLDKVRCAVDQQMLPLDAPLGEAREIAFFPPVTGG